MRVGLVLVVLFLASMPSVHAGDAQTPELVDAPADVTTNFAFPVSDDLSRALDLTAIWFSKDDAGHYWIHTKVTDLSPIVAIPAGSDFGASWSTNFMIGTDSPTYHVSTSITSAPRTWRCTVQDGTTGQWVETAGLIDIDANLLHVRLTDDMANLLDSAQTTGNLNSQAWGAIGDAAQEADWAFAGAPYVPGLWPIEPAPSPTLAPCGLQRDHVAPPFADAPDLGPLQIADPLDDVTRSGDGTTSPAHDDLSQALDILGVSYTRDPEGGYWNHIRLANLTTVAAVTRADHASLQYASTFTFDNATRGYETRATNGGYDYARPAGSWRCNSHDETSKEWPETIGFVDVARGILHIKVPSAPASTMASGARVTRLSASAWGSTGESSRPQTHDWAQSTVTFVAQDLVVVPAPSGDGLVACGKDQTASPGSTAPPAASSRAPATSRAIHYTAPQKGAASSSPPPEGHRVPAPAAALPLAMLIIAAFASRRR